MVGTTWSLRITIPWVVLSRYRLCGLYERTKGGKLTQLIVLKEMGGKEMERKRHSRSNSKNSGSRGGATGSSSGSCYINPSSTHPWHDRFVVQGGREGCNHPTKKNVAHVREPEETACDEFTCQPERKKKVKSQITREPNGTTTNREGERYAKRVTREIVVPWWEQTNPWQFVLYVAYWWKMRWRRCWTLVEQIDRWENKSKNEDREKDREIRISVNVFGTKIWEGRT